MAQPIPEVPADSSTRQCGNVWSMVEACSAVIDMRQSRLPWLPVGLRKWFHPDLTEVCCEACERLYQAVYSCIEEWEADRADARDTALTLVGPEMQFHDLRRMTQWVDRFLGAVESL